MDFPELAPVISFGDLAAMGALAVALFGAWRALRDFSRSLRELKYSELDRLYFDLQRAALDYPAVHVPVPPTGNPTDAQRRYDTYALMVWAFVETVCDRCERDETLHTTWYPIVRVEKERHIAWLRRPENAALFKESFVKKFVKD
ncbi:MAG: hypothetical protein ACXW3O_15760 [Brevundimonas sp.]